MTQYFVGAPFALTADRHAAESWAGRPDVLSKLQKICRSYSSRPDSSLCLIWANLGAGKTHALLHLAHLLRLSSAVPAYVEMPQQPKRFIDLYQRVIEELQTADLVDASRATGLPVDLARALRVLEHGSPTEQQVVRSWLTGGKPPLRELKAASGIGERIDDDARARDVLCALVAAFAKRGRRVVVLLDEFQRIGSVSAKQRETLLSHLRSVFSSNPSYFSLVIAVASRIEKTAMDLLPQELRTLMGVQPTVSLPEMNIEEAIQFLGDRLSSFRPSDFSGERTAPFGDAVVKAAVEFVAETDSARLVPRTLLQAMAYLFDEAGLDASVPLTVSRVKSLLKELRWDA